MYVLGLCRSPGPHRVAGTRREESTTARETGTRRNGHQFRFPALVEVETGSNAPTSVCCLVIPAMRASWTSVVGWSATSRHWSVAHSPAFFYTALHHARLLFQRPPACLGARSPRISVFSTQRLSHQLLYVVGPGGCAGVRGARVRWWSPTACASAAGAVCFCGGP